MSKEVDLLSGCMGAVFYALVLVYMCFEVCGRVWEVVDGDLCRVYE